MYRKKMLIYFLVFSALTVLSFYINRFFGYCMLGAFIIGLTGYAKYGD